MGYHKNLNEFQKLMLLRCFRVDRIYRAVTEYITQVMGEKYVTPPIISFDSIYEQSSPVSPIVFILSPGSDPASDLMKLAERIDFGTNKIKFLSMGQGQEKVRMGNPSGCMGGDDGLKGPPVTTLWRSNIFMVEIFPPNFSDCYWKWMNEFLWTKKQFDGRK